MDSWQVDELLAELARRRWDMYCFGERHHPEAIAAVFAWTSCVDMVMLRSETEVAAYRAPRKADEDPLAPELVVWHYVGPALWTLRAVLALVHPNHPDAPLIMHPTPAVCRVPEITRRPMTYRPGRQISISSSDDAPPEAI
jgi:hypothetical protein